MPIGGWFSVQKSPALCSSGHCVTHCSVLWPLPKRALPAALPVSLERTLLAVIACFPGLSCHVTRCCLWRWTDFKRHSPSGLVETDLRADGGPALTPGKSLLRGISGPETRASRPLFAKTQEQGIPSPVKPGGEARERWQCWVWLLFWVGRVDYGFLSWSEGLDRALSPTLSSNWLGVWNPVSFA